MTSGYAIGKQPASRNRAAMGAMRPTVIDRAGRWVECETRLCADGRHVMVYLLGDDPPAVGDRLSVWHPDGVGEGRFREVVAVEDLLGRLYLCDTFMEPERVHDARGAEVGAPVAEEPEAKPDPVDAASIPLSARQLELLEAFKQRVLTMKEVASITGTNPAKWWEGRSQLDRLIAHGYPVRQGARRSGDTSRGYYFIRGVTPEAVANVQSQWPRVLELRRRVGSSLTVERIIQETSVDRARAERWACSLERVFGQG